MSLTLRRWHLFPALTSLLLLLWIHAARAGADERSHTADAHFGPRLYLLSAPNDEIPARLPPTVVLHAQLHTELGAHYLTHFVASGGVSDLAIMEDNGLAVRMLDADTSGKIYYFADAQAERAAPIAVQFGQVLYANATVILIGAPAIHEQTMLDALLAQGAPVAALTADPLNLQRSDDLIVQQVAASAQAAPDPTIAALLAELTTGDLAVLINELSGEAPVTIDGATVTLATRHTLSSQIENAERYLHQYYTELGMNVSYHDWTFGNYSGRNVIVDIPGVTNPERIWILGGHFDTLSESPYSSAPGADDNGSGTAATMLIARLLRDYQFAETVRFVHFSGEEQGQWGSKRYATELNQADAQIMGYVDLDMIGYDGNGDQKMELHTGMSNGSNALGAAFIDNNNEYSQGLVIEHKTTSATRFSDHSPFWDNGYAAFLAIEDFFDNVATNDRDRNPQYHRTGDKLNLVDLDYVLRTARVSLATVAELASIQPADPNATPTHTPGITDTPTATLTFTPLPSGCQKLLVNGDLEGGSGWSFGSTPFPAAIVDTVSHGGQRSIRLGIPPDATNRVAHSSAFQEVMIPAQADQVTLRYWQRRGGAADSVDYQEALLLNDGYDVMARLERNYAVTEPDQWVERSFDLTAYRGQTIVVYLNVYNNGGGGQQWNYVDDIALLSCTEGQATATPSATATLGDSETHTPTATPTFTNTPDPDGTPVETPTTTPSLSPTTAPGDLTERSYLPLVQK